jgi:hypothetical protein
MITSWPGPWQDIDDKTRRMLTTCSQFSQRPTVSLSYSYTGPPLPPDWCAWGAPTINYPMRSLDARAVPFGRIGRYSALSEQISRYPNANPRPPRTRMQRTVSSITASDVEGCMCVWECVCLSEQNIGMLHRGPMGESRGLPYARTPTAVLACLWFVACVCLLVRVVRWFALAICCLLVDVCL